MYRCSLCEAVSRPSEPLIKVVVPKRKNPKQIAREVPVCRACAKQVEAGMSLAEIERSIRNLRAPEHVEPAAPPPIKAVSL